MRHTLGRPACALLLVVLAACGSGPAAPGPATPATVTGPSRSAAAPWEIPSAAYPSQRLFRINYEGPEGDGTLKMVLRLESPERYRLTLSDRLGRTLFTVDAAVDHLGGVGGMDGWLMDHRERLACRLEEGLHLEGVPLEPFAVDALPAVLLGRLPAAPEDPGAVLAELSRRPAAGELDYRDRLGRRWTAQLAPAAAARVRTWILWRGGEPALWWRSTDAGEGSGGGAEALLSDRLRGVQMRWKEVAREPLGERLPEPGRPAGFGIGECVPGPEGEPG